MKKRTDFILLAVFFLSLALYLYVVPFIFGNRPPPRPWLSGVVSWLLKFFHAVPAFCLQLVLCRRSPRVLACLTALIPLAVSLWSGLGCLVATGWDQLLFACLLLWSAAPTVGCILAWAVYGCWELYRKGDIRHS